MNILLSFSGHVELKKKTLCIIMDPIFSHLKCLIANRLAKEVSAILCTMKISIKLSLLLYKATSRMIL